MPVIIRPQPYYESPSSPTINFESTFSFPPPPPTSKVHKVSWRGENLSLLSYRWRTRQIPLVVLIERPGRSLKLHNLHNLRPPRRREYKPGCCFLSRLKDPLKVWRETETPQIRQVSASVFPTMTTRTLRTGVCGYLPTPGHGPIFQNCHFPKICLKPGRELREL